MGKSSQRKGAGGENEIVKLLRTRGYDVRRGGSLTFGTVPDVYGIDGVHLEVKRCEQYRLDDWMRQAEYDAARFGDGAPVVVFRKNRGQWFVCMRLADWTPPEGR